VFNELFLLFGFTYFTHLFSAFISESWIRFRVGWYFVGILALFIAINLIIVCITIVAEIILKVKMRKVQKRQDAWAAKQAIIKKDIEERQEKFRELTILD
jgi:hypothetical protein